MKKLLRLPISKSLYLIECLYELCVLFYLALALAHIDIAPEDEPAATTASSISPEGLDRLPVPPVPVPPMPDILIAGHVREAERARLISTECEEAQSNDRRVNE